FQKVCGEAGVGTKHERPAPVDEASVEVRDRHRGSADGCLAVDLGVVAVDDFLVRRAQELTRNWEAAVALGFWDARGLQQVQRATAGADENEPSLDGEFPIVEPILDGNFPATV